MATPLPAFKILLTHFYASSAALVIQIVLDSLTMDGQVTCWNIQIAMMYRVYYKLSEHCPNDVLFGQRATGSSLPNGFLTLGVFHN
jgi:hypothetical protein